MEKWVSTQAEAYQRCLLLSLGGLQRQNELLFHRVLDPELFLISTYAVRVIGQPSTGGIRHFAR